MLIHEYTGVILVRLHYPPHPDETTKTANYRGRQRNARVTGTGIESGTFNYSSKRLYIDMLAEYYLWKRIGLFVNLRNVGNATENTEIYGPSTPEHAQFRQRIDYASLWTIGVKGTF